MMIKEKGARRGRGRRLSNGSLVMGRFGGFRFTGEDRREERCREMAQPAG